ncbi:MAG: hypothetical protein LBL90_11235 [Prevotellaceae bacterium]|jgi:hypothetical protein|nr:hypothetical protein [Prevotellaceae bacterium]
MIKFVKNKARTNAIASIRKQLRRHMGFCNFDTIKSVGIIVRYQFDIENEAVNKLLDFFKQKSIRPEILVYYPDKKLPANVIVREGMLLFVEGGTNWFGKPQKQEIESFINTDFGLLIDLSPQHVFSLQYIVEASKASFKVGRMSYKDDPYDFVLLGDLDNDSKYVDDLFRYLTKLEK